MAASDRLSELADAVVYDTAVDWDAAESSAGADDQAVIRQLRLVASIGHTARASRRRWGPFELRERLGEGSFGEVYRAWDPRLNRDVALKLLHAAADDGDEVIHEARLLAKVEHPNIVPVYGADVHDGQVGLWMKLVEGKTLKQLIEEQGPLGAEEAARIGRDLCSALAAVHKAGLVHRDIKAQNVMREVGGRILLMDFGAGDTIEAAKHDSIKGSPAYLAPEVIAGDAPTPQSDVYSLGALLFYLVSGEFPVRADSWDELRTTHTRGGVRCLRDVRPEVPGWYVDAVDAATAVSLALRPATMGGFASALLLAAPPAASSLPRPYRWAIVGALPLALAASVLVTRWQTPAPALPVRVYDSVAVLPFQDRSQNVEFAYLAAGVAQEISSKLSRIKGLRIVSDASSKRSRVLAAAVPLIAKELDVTAVLRGSVSRSSDRVYVAAELVDGVTGDLLWSEELDRAAEDLAKIQSEVSYKVARALRGSLSHADVSWLESSRSQTAESYDLYLRGRYHWSLRSEDGFRHSLRFYQAALERDPALAVAYAGIADTYSQMGQYGVMPLREAVALAEQAVTQAIAQDPTLAEAHASLGYIRKGRFEWSGAEVSLTRALELNPNYPQAHHWYGILLAQTGRFHESIASMKSAIALDPLSISAAAQLGAVLLLDRRYDEAIRQLDAVLEMDSSFSAAHQVVGEALCHKGDHEAAIASYQEAARVAALGRENHEQIADLGLAYARAGRRQEAVAVLNELLRRAKNARHGIAANVATVYAGLGDTEAAFRWLAMALERRDPELGYLKVDPRWDSLREDVRFEELLDEVGLSTSR